MKALSPDDSIPDPPDLLSLGSPNKGLDLAEKIVRKCSILKYDDADIVKAHDRVKCTKPPADQGKESVKDCNITESYLRLTDNLVSAGFSRNTVFASSNINDYQQGYPSLHPVLREEFKRIRLEYSPNWSAARHELDRAVTPR